MGAGLAKLREDLVESRQESPEGVYHVLKDPVAGRYYRLQDLEYAIARDLDGTRTAEELRVRLATAHDAEITPEDLDAFIASLDKRGLLEGSAPPPAPPGIATRWRTNPLYFRLRAFDPDRLFDRVLPWVRWCFTPWFVAGSLLLIAWAVGIVVLDHAAIVHDLRRLWRFQSLLLAWVVILSVTALHEFGHGLTCKRFGGEVKEIGFLLIYLQPAFFCNISDTWLFTKRSHRYWVTAAGAWIETTLWALATLVWRVTERETWLSGMALVVMATSGIKVFFNVNPLIKLDGYYLFSDLLQVPNLRARASAYVWGLVRRLFGGRGAEPPPSPRERRIFLVYGVLASLFSYWLLTSVLTQFGRHLTYQYQGTGAVAFAGVVGLTFLTPLKQAIAGFPGLARTLWTAWRKTTLFALGIGALFLIPLPLRVAGPVEIFPAQNADVRAEVEGIVAEVYVDEGTWVPTGAPLARLDDRVYRTQLAALDASIGGARARLALLRAGVRPESIAVARLAVAQADERLRASTQARDRVRALAATQAASREELERGESNVALLTQERDQAEAALRLAEAGPRAPEVAAAEEGVAEAEAERARVADQLTHILIVAPHPGYITTPRIKQKVGERMAPGDLVAEVYETGTVRAEVAVSERDIGDVRVGAPASVRLRAYPERAFTGTVTAIAPAATDEGGVGDRVVRVSVSLDNREGLLRPRLTGYARIASGDRRAIDLLTRRFRRFLRVEFWSWW